MSENTEKPEMTREEILTATCKAREQEVMHYQINIDNYTIALEELGKMSAPEAAELAGFGDQLRSLLASETLEQKKAKLMLAVVKRQLG